MQRIGGAGTNAGQAAYAALFNHHHRSLGMASAWRIDLEWQERLKGQWRMQRSHPVQSSSMMATID